MSLRHHIPVELVGIGEELLRQRVSEDRLVRHEESGAGLIEHLRESPLRSDFLAQLTELLPGAPAFSDVGFKLASVLAGDQEKVRFLEEFRVRLQVAIFLEQGAGPGSWFVHAWAQE